MIFSNRKAKKDDNLRRRNVPRSQPGIYSYYSQRNDTVNKYSKNTGRGFDRTSKLQNFKLSIKYLPSYIALVAVILGVLYSLWLQPTPRISLENKKGTIYRSSQQYSSEIEAIWKSSILNQTKLTVKSSAISQEILNRYGELSDAKINLPLLGRRPTITLTPQSPALQLVNGSGSYYVSSSGRLMAKVADVTKNEIGDIPIVLDESGLDAELGKIVMPKQEAEFLMQLYKYVKDAKLPVSSITISGTNANQVDLRLVGSSYFIKFSIDSDVRQAVGSYLAIINKLKNEGITPQQYIDVRIDEKVFYK